MRDVADLARVSMATVSFVLNDTKPVSAATRARVEEAMAQLGFRRNALARALASRRTRIIALLFPALRHRLSGTAVNFFAGAAEASTALGYNLMLWPVDNDSDNLADLTSSGLIDGVLLMEVQLDDHRVEQLQTAGTPFTLIGRTRDPSAFSYVDIDFEGTIVQSVERLTALGHRNICFVGGNYGRNRIEGYGPAVRTEETFLATMRDRGLSGQAMFCGESARDGRAFAPVVLKEAPDATAIIVMNENAIVGMVSEFGKLGIRIPEDLSVLLIGSTAEVASMADPELAVMTSPAAELGRMGVEALIDELEGRSTVLKQERVIGPFVDGPSLGPVPPHGRPPRDFFSRPDRRETVRGTPSPTSTATQPQ